MQLGNLRFEYERVAHSLRCCVADEDYASLAIKLEDLKNLATFENRSISVYDLLQKKLLVKVDRHLELLGYTDTDMLEMCDIDRYHAMVHSDDLAYLYDSELKMYYFLKSLPGEEKKDYKLVYDYRVRAKNGTYIRFLHQMAIYELDRCQNSWILLILSDVLSRCPEDEEPKRFLINTKTRHIHSLDDPLNVCRQFLTVREHEIIDLISQGLDSWTIAQRLYISEHTVNNHRQHVLQKTSSKNVAQAIMYLRCIGLL